MNTSTSGPYGIDSVDPIRVFSRRPDRVELEERAFRPRGEERHALHLVSVVLVEVAGLVPVVAGLVIVPERDLRHFRIESPHVIVEQVVLVLAAELVERLGRLRFRLGDDVAPERSVVQFDLRRHRLIGVDRVAAVDEEVGLGTAHRVVQLEAAPLLVDAPALADRVCRPRDRHVSAGRRGLGRPEASAVRLAPGLEIREVLEEDAIEDTLAGRQIREDHACGEVGRVERRRSHSTKRVLEFLGRRVFDDETGRTIGASSR